MLHQSSCKEQSPAFLVISGTVNDLCCGRSVPLILNYFDLGLLKMHPEGFRLSSKA